MTYKSKAGGVWWVGWVVWVSVHNDMGEVEKHILCLPLQNPGRNLLALSSSHYTLRKERPFWQWELGGYCKPLHLWYNSHSCLARWCQVSPKNDQFQISPATSPEVLHHTVWRTWLFIANTQMKDEYTTNSHYLTYTCLPKRLGECTFWTWEWMGP